MQKLFKTKSDFSVFERQSGMALAEVMIAAGIMSVIALGAASFQASQIKENRAMTEKLATVDVSRFLTGILASNNSCTSMLTASNLVNPSDLTFNSTIVTASAPHRMTLKSVPQTSIALGQAASVVASTVVVMPNGPTPGIELDVTSATDATLVVRFDKTKLVRGLHDLVFPNIQILTAGAPTALTILGCGSGPTITTCLGWCGGAFPKQIGGVAMYNWFSKDGTKYYSSLGVACGAMAPGWSGWSPGGASPSGSHPTNAQALVFCTK